MKSIYNEQRYLYDIEALEFFEQGRDTYKKYVVDSLEKNKDIIKDYNTYLDCIVDELLKYKLDSSLDYSIALGYLINKGYLSEGLIFDSNETDKEILGKLGISILHGSGCCRNICDMQKDIFERLNIDIIPFYCFQGNDFFNRGLNKKANHIINLVEYDNNLYGIDLYNNSLLYSFKNSYIMKSISSVKDTRLRYKPYYEIILDGKKFDNIKEEIKAFESYSKEKTISSFQYEMGLKDEIENILFNNKDQLERFNNKTKTLRRDIISKMNR